MKHKLSNHVIAECTLQIGQKVFVSKGLFKTIEDKDGVVEDVKYSIGCESGFLVKVDIYPDWIDSNWILEI